MSQHIICNRKQGHYSDCRICEMMTLDEIRYKPATYIVFKESEVGVFISFFYDKLRIQAISFFYLSLLSDM